MRYLIAIAFVLTIKLPFIEAFHYVRINSQQMNNLNSYKKSLNDVQPRSQSLASQVNSRIFYVKIAPPASYSSSSPSFTASSSSPLSPSSYSTVPNSLPLQSNSVENYASRNSENENSLYNTESHSGSSLKKSDLSISKVFTPHLLRNSDLYKLPLKFISNARPILIKGIRTALAPRAEEKIKRITSLKPTKLHKNVYRYLTESKTIREGASRIISLPTKFISNAQPWRAILMKNSFTQTLPGDEDLIIDNRNIDRRFSQEYSGYNREETKSKNIISDETKSIITKATIKMSKTGRKLPGKSIGGNGNKKLASPAMIAKYGLKHSQLI